jgi:MFS family permease
MSEKTKVSGGQIAIFVTLMLMYFIAPTHSNVNVVSTDLMNVYGVDATAISYMVSITNLLEIPAAFIIGLIGGRKLSYKACALIATALTVIGGLPAIMGASLPWGGIIATRCILGLGLGCYMPIVNAVISLLFQKESIRATMMSAASLVFNVGMICCSSIAGILGAISWNLAWAIYLWAFIPFLLAVPFINDKNLPKVSMTDEKGEKVKIRLPLFGWMLLLLFLCTIIMSQSLFNLGGVTIGAVVNSSAVIGTVFSLFSVGAIITAVLFGPAYRFLRAQALTCFWIIGVIGYLLWYVAHVTGNVPLFYVAIILCGVGTNCMTIGVSMVLSVVVAPAIVAAMMGFAYVFQNGGGFLASPVDQVVSMIGVSDSIMSSVWIFNIILGVIVVIGLFLVAKKANSRADELARVSS